MMKKLMSLWLILRVYWSNFKGIYEKYDHHITFKDHFNKDDCFAVNTKSILKEIMSKFTYQYDGPSDLFDYMAKPEQCYLSYLTGKLQDDCDGYHGCVYHILTKNGYDCALLTYLVPDLTQCHTCVVAKAENQYFLVDYTNIKAYRDLDTLLSVLKLNKPEMFDFNLVKFDYSKQRYYIVNMF